MRSWYRRFSLGMPIDWDGGQWRPRGEGSALGKVVFRFKSQIWFVTTVEFMTKAPISSMEIGISQRSWLSVVSLDTLFRFLDILLYCQLNPLGWSYSRSPKSPSDFRMADDGMTYQLSSHPTNPHRAIWCFFQVWGSLKREKIMLI